MLPMSLNLGLAHKDSNREVVAFCVCRNLPFDRRARQNRKVHLLMKKMRGSRHQRLFEENIRKTKKGSMDFENKGSGVVYTWGRY